MNNLFDGVKKFSNSDFEKNKELFVRLGDGQKPHTLFIGCSDSRVVPGLITKTMPGELFVVRNIANVVPYYRSSSEFLATTSAIEYALKILNVENIVVCGHSNCGGCKALYMPEEQLMEIPHVKKWLELIANARIQAELQIKELPYQQNYDWLVEQINIVEQMNHLLTYPFVQDRFQNGKLNIYGWYYEIATGSVYNYNKMNKEFEKIT